MEFLNKPMSEFWKSTKETFAEIMDMNDSVIGGGKKQPVVPGASGGQGGSGSGGANTAEKESNDGPSLQATRTAGDVGSANPETDTTLRENIHVYQKHSVSKTKRPVSEDIRNRNTEYNTFQQQPSSKTVHSTHQVKEQTRHSFNTSIGKFWKDFNFKTFNMNPASNSGGSKSETTTTKNSHHGKVKPGTLHSKERKTANSAIENESEKVLRSHRTHSQSRSRQGSLSDSQHFRSNSTDRASVRKYRQSIDKSRPFQRSASDDSMMSEQVAQHDSEEDSEDISAEKMKTKILSMWNNVRYGWTVKTRTAFSLAKPIWILGKSFQHNIEDAEERFPGLDTVKSPAMELFKREFSSRIWLTYRREFPQLAGSSYTTDTGWGCMLRSGQMMLAQALVQHFLGRDWNYYSEQTMEEQRYHHEIVRWFGDQPDDMSPFSLHRLVELGKSSGKKAGDWYGPASVAHIFKEAMDQAMDLNPLLEQLCVYVAQDCTIYKADVLNLCKRKRPGSLQPVYSDHHSPASPPSTVPPPLSSSPQQPAEPDPKAVGPPSTSTVVPQLGLDATVANQAEEEEQKSSRLNTIPQSSQTDFSSSSELNGSSAPKAHPPSVFPANSDQADRSTEPSSDPPKKSPVRSHPPPVSAKPKRVHRPHLNGSSSKPDEELSPRPQTGDTRKGMELSDAARHINGEPVRAPSLTQNEEHEREDDTSSTWCAVVILVPVRLGGDEVNPIYINSVQALFTLDCCIGIIGGKPKHSLYYVGFQEEKLIHLDPHYCQPVVDMKSREFSLSSFHCMSPRKMAINKMDPSCTVGFYLRTEEDFNQFCEIVPSIVEGPSSGSSRDYPMFILRDGSCCDWNSQHSTNDGKPERYLRVRHVNQNGQLIAPMRETEDFVFLDS